MNKKDLQKLQNLLTRIPQGKITTYNRLARAMRMPKACRYVGYLLKSNPEPEKFPCYKVVKSDGGVGGYSGEGGVKEKIRRLRSDGIIIKKRKVVFLRECIFSNFS